MAATSDVVLLLLLLLLLFRGVVIALFSLDVRVERE
jgi:hypothetical protein